MDLISSLTVIDWVAGISAVMILSTFSRELLAMASKLWASWSSNPTVQVVVNNTLVFLKNTEVMWRPVLNMSLTVLAPLGEKALMILKPFGTMGLVVADAFVRGVVLLGFMTIQLVLTIIDGFHSFLRYTKSMGLDLASSIQTASVVLKDFTLSLVKIVNWIGYAIYKVAFSLSFVLDSFEKCGTFLHRIIFEAHKVSWNDIYNISIPFLVVASILGVAMWRLSTRFASKPIALSKKFDDEYGIPRRSSRLARKRSFLYCQDLNSPMSATKMLASKEPSSTSSNL